MDEREELVMLRRLAELEAKASGGAARTVAPDTRPKPQIDPSEGRLPFSPFGIDTGLTMPQGVSRFMAGAGKAYSDLGRGVGQIFGQSTREDADEVARRDAPLMDTGAGIAGNIGGSVALSAPAILAGPVAGTIGGGAALGAGMSALQPVGTNDSRTQNALIGGALGAAVPAAARVAKVAKAALIDPFTEAGRTRIVGGTLNRAASDPQAAAANMEARTGATPGFLPTAGQAADDAGIASVERAARSIDPAGFGDIDKSQRAAVINALRGIAKTPEDRAAAVDAVEKQARNLYGEAFKENVDVTPQLTRLAGRPSMQKAETRAQALARELGIPFQASLKDMQPQSITMPGQSGTQSSINQLVDVPAEFLSVPPTMPTQSSYVRPGAPVDPYRTTPQPGPQEIVENMRAPNWDFQVPGTGVQRVEEKVMSGIKPPNWTMEIPPVDSVPVRDMHTLKMSMDALMADPTAGIAGREAAATNATRNKLLDLLPESYQVARRGHIEMNKPVNQMDIGKELYNRLVPAAADGADIPYTTRAQAFAEALRGGDKLAKRVTGLKNAKMDEMMTPDQMATLKGIVSDNQMKATAETAGRGVGSDTVQKMAMSNLIAETGLPSWISAISGPLRPAGGMLKTAGDILYTKNDETMRHLLADVLKDPTRAADAMKKAGIAPSKLGEYLKRMSQVPAIGAGAASANE